MFVAALKRLKPTISANASVPKDGRFNQEIKLSLYKIGRPTTWENATKTYDNLCGE
jgi:hypothetical protein